MTLPWIPRKIPRLLVKVSGLQGKVAWQDLKDHMKQAGKVSQLQRSKHSWKKCRPKMESWVKTLVTQKHLFWKKYGKHIFICNILCIYIYTESSGRVWNCFPEKNTHTKRRNIHFCAEIWHQTGLDTIIIWILSRWLYPWRMVPPFRNGFIGGSKHPPAVRNYPVQNVCCMMFDFPTQSVQGKA